MCVCVCAFTHKQIFIRLRRSRELHLATSYNLATPCSCTNLSSQVYECKHNHRVARKNLCKNVVLRDCGRLQGAISYFLKLRSSQVNDEAANDVDPKY